MDPLLEPLRRALAGEPLLRLAVLFGSHATGRARAGSDVDVAILPCEDLSLAAELDLAARLSQALCREVDLVRLDHANVLVRWEVARDGVCVLAEPAYEWTRFRAHAASEHADLAEPLRIAAELYRRRVAESAP